MAQDSAPSNFMALPTRLAAAMRNAIDIARMGRLEQPVRSPFEVAFRDPNYRLRHYHGAPAGSAPIILVPPLMITSEVYDVSPSSSTVTLLADCGVDPWVVDFGSPEQEEGGLTRTLTDHVVAISRAIDQVREVTGQDVHLAGYSQGGIFCYLAAALRKSEGLASVITYGTPVNVHENVLPGIPDDLALSVVETLGNVITSGMGSASIPAWMTRNGFKLMSPTKEIRNQLEFLLSLHDRDALLRKEGQRRFLSDEGWVAWPGPAFRDFFEQMILGNRLFAGGFVVEGRTVTLADMTCPVLAFAGANDDIARPHTVRSVINAAPSAEIYECSVAAGHMGLVVGSRAMRETWPTTVEWIDWRSGKGKKPELVFPIIDDEEAEEPLAESKRREEADRNIVAIAGAIGRDAVEMMIDVIGEGAETVRAVGGNLVSQLPRLARLEGLRRESRIGLALTLTEQAETNPNGTFFLYEGRAHSYADADRRIDAIVKGLISVGIRTGDHVGLLMGTRPTTLAVAAAINRIGAVAVLHRPEEDLAAELEAADVDHLISDPENAKRAAKIFAGQVYVLGGVGQSERKIPKHTIDLEPIDHEAVVLPDWYEPSPGKSDDVAFILFAGHGPSLRANRITNRRWALSALGTATATGMGPGDTVYSWTSVQHPTGLLVSVSGALAAGSRLALAHGFSAETFWEEVRSYGASIVFYSGSMLNELVDAPRSDAEHNNPVRMFAGSGMPAPVWRRVVERFDPVTILEFYASTEGNAILANVAGKKVGSVGRPLPGSADIELALWNHETRSPQLDEAGYVQLAEDGEIGMMLARVEKERSARTGKPLRNVFTRGDAWYVTGGLFRRDEDGDYWLVDRVDDLIRLEDERVPTSPIEEAVWQLDSISAAAAYGLPIPGEDVEVPVVAVVLRDGHKFDPDALASAVVAELPPRLHPRLVRIVDSLPMTAGYRILKAPLREEGIGRLSKGKGKHKARVYTLEGGLYTPADAEAIQRIGLA